MRNTSARWVVFPLLSFGLAAQPAAEINVIRNWTAPQYWTPSMPEGTAARHLNRQNDERALPYPDAAATSSNQVTGATSVLSLVGITPCRLMDTRDNSLPAPFGPPSMASLQVRTITVLSSGRCGIPSNALAYSMNFTVVPLQGVLGYLSAWPTPNRPVPEVSILNSPTGQTIANGAVVPAGTNGSIDVFVTHTVELIIDINGYYVPNSPAIPVPLSLSGGQSVPTLSVANTYSGSTATDPLAAPGLGLVVNGFNATGTFGYAGGRGMLVFGGTGGLASAQSGRAGGQGGVGLQVFGGTAGNGGYSQGGNGGTAIVANGGDGAGGANATGFGGRGITVTGGAGGPGSQGGVGIFAIGGLAGGAGSGGTAGLFVSTDNGYAGAFAGPVSVSGTLTKPAGSFRIDHPQDPAGKYLSHSFVESPDMMNVYNGNAVLDESGAAWVQLADWFETLNRDFRYQLTAIGAPAPGLFIAEEVENNRFKIAGGKPGGRVSWTVTGIRHDAYANAYRIPVEEVKPPTEQNTYLHPELYNQPEDRNVLYALHPELLKDLNTLRRRIPDTVTERKTPAPKAKRPLGE